MDNSGQIQNRNLWMDYLRTTITIMVVAHHSFLSYTTFASFDSQAYIRSTHPIVDVQRWVGLDIAVNFNDIFIMSLMFFIGGLFLIRSLNKKGAGLFIRDRYFRLFVPFLILGTFFMLIAYFPSYYVAYNKIDILHYLKDFFTTEGWPVGPPWFLWVLFIFNLLFALFHKQYAYFGAKMESRLMIMKDRPFLLLLGLFTITWLLYVPLAYRAGAGKWVGFGPFDFQLSRILLYFGYFSAGIVIGKSDFNAGLFSRESRTVKLWWLWVFLAVAIFVILTIGSGFLGEFVERKSINEFTAWMIYYAIYALSCALSSLAFITCFRKWVSAGSQWMNSLTDNAYLIYLVHYIFVVWTQFVLLKFNMPAFLKFMITFILSFALSWLTGILLSKIKLFRLYI